METEGVGMQAWPWPDSLDALVAAPVYHKLLLENDHVRVLDVRIAPGQTVPVHTHKWFSIIHVKSAGDFIRRDGNGKLLFDSRNAGSAENEPTIVWTDPLPPHSVENIGDSEIHLLSIELKHVTS